MDFKLLMLCVNPQGIKYNLVKIIITKEFNESISHNIFILQL